jgi:hypothetical protein
VELTQIQPPAQILELGTGPGIATLPFAQLDFFLLGLEPNPEAADLAQKICVEYPRVTIQKTTFEEWEVEPERFEAILAATSWHWIASEISYPKAHIALKDQGWLILLWNTPPQISDEIYRQLDEIYQRLAPSIPAYARFETIESQAEHFRQFGQDIIKSGYFENLIYEDKVYKVIYSIEDYLALLSTLSVYIALESDKRTILFDQLGEALAKINGDYLELSYLSAFHLAKKRV